MDDFEKEIKAEFLNEAATLLEDAEQAFLLLEQGDAETITKIFRLAHNLKGSSKAVGFDHVGEFTYHWESLLLKVKEGQLAVSKGLVNLLLACLDHVRNMIETLRSDMDATFDSQELLERMEAAGKGELGEGSSEAAPAEESAAPAVEEVSSQAPTEEAITAAEIAALEASPEDFAAAADALIELNFARQAAEAQAAAAPPAPAPAAPAAPAAKAEAKEHPPKPEGGPKKPAAPVDEAIRVSTSKLEKLIDYVGEMVILQSVLREQAEGNDPVQLKKTVSQLGKVSKEIQDISMGLRMLPIKPTFAKMQRIVRDTAVALGKEIHLVLEGEETEVDKTVLERLGDPLVHLIRNSVDHGIESKDTRLQNGKSAHGTVTLSARQQAGKMVIEVIDDGGGIHPDKVLKKATEKGLVKPGQQMSPKDILHLIFAPGFSTKEVVTDVSGRGVGMDVVKTNIEQIGGEVQIESEVGFGTTFRIVLPLSLAILECTVVRSGQDRYVIPSYHITESLKADKSILRQTLLGEILMLRGENLPLLRLKDILRSKPGPESGDPIALIVRSGAAPFAMVVDDIIGQYQIVTKPLSPELRNLKGIAGSTILGDGRPALILEINQFATAIAGKKPNSGRENRGVA